MAATNETTGTSEKSTRNSDISIEAIEQMLHLMDDPVFALHSVIDTLAA